MWRIILTLCLALAIPCHADNASDGLDAFVDAVEKISTLEGRFQQRHYDQGDVLMGESSGRFSLLRPSYFLWEIQSPDSQLVIATPQYLWHHDLDLETVTRRPLGSGGDLTPLQILSGDQAVLRERFAISTNGKGVFHLRAREVDVGFEEVQLELSGSQVTRMEIRDDLKQRLVIEFSDMRAGVELSAEDFAFTPPADADIFYYDE